MDDIKIAIYEYLLKKRDLLDLNIILGQETDLKEIERLEQEIEELRKDVDEKYYFIISTEEGYEELLKVENELRGNGGVRSWKLDEMYMEAMEQKETSRSEKLIDKFIEKDRKELGLREYKIYTVRKEDLEKQLDKEFRNYNADILYTNEDIEYITIMEGISKDRKKVSLYYYPYENYKLRR